MTDQTLNDEPIADNSEWWLQYLELLKERRGEKIYELAAAEGPPNFEEGTIATVHGTEFAGEFRVSKINDQNGKFTLRPRDKFTNPAAKYREGEIVLIKGAEFTITRTDHNKMLAKPLPPQEMERPDLFQVTVNSGATGKPIMVMVGGTQEELEDNVALLTRIFDLVRAAARDDIDEDDLRLEADQLCTALGLTQKNDEEESDDEPVH